MEDYKYLKPESYYSDLYDRFTVEECRRWEKRGISEDFESTEDKLSAKGKIKREFIVTAVIPTALYFIKGERYADKSQTIRKWMEQDESKDKFYESAMPPTDVRCLKCQSTMNLLDKNFIDKLDKSYRVLFMFDCPNGCLPRRAFYDDGEEWKPKPNLCPKCGGNLNVEDKTTEAKFITHYRCSACGFTKTEEFECMANKKEKIDENFEKDKQRFCLSKEEGQEYIEYAARLRRVTDSIKESEEKDKITKAIAKIKKLTVVELEKLLTPTLEKENYIHLQLVNPEIDRNVIVPFTVQDSKTGRESRASEYDLKRLFKKALADTNWRLMSEGVNYRLGILSGKLKGYESDEDLLKLIR